MKKILVPVDFSRQAEYALEFAIEIARETGAKVIALHVVEFPVGAAVDPVGLPVPTQLDADFVGILKENSRERMSDFFDRINFSGNVERRVDVGNPYITITEFVADEEADLVVMGTKGASGMKEFFIGSNAEKVVRLAKCPVITLHNKTHLKDVKNIVYATDLEDPSEELVTEVKRLQDLFHATIHLVRINTPNRFERDVVSRKALENIAKRYMLKDYTLNIFNDVYEDQGVIAFANEIGADLIALGTHGRTGISHLISGSTAEDIVNHATQPIWTFRMGKKRD